MSLLSKVKSLLGMDTEERSGGTVDVTVERESGSRPAPDAESERAVKESVGETGVPETETPDRETEKEDETPDRETEKEDETPDRETETEAEATSGGDLEDLKGVGPAYADRLRDAGYPDMDALTEADAEEVGERTDLSPKRVSNWIEQAKARRR